MGLASHFPEYFIKNRTQLLINREIFLKEKSVEFFNNIEEKCDIIDFDYTDGDIIEDVQNNDKYGNINLF